MPRSSSKHDALNPQEKGQSSPPESQEADLSSLDSFDEEFVKKTLPPLEIIDRSRYKEVRQIGEIFVPPDLAYKSQEGKPSAELVAAYEGAAKALKDLTIAGNKIYQYKGNEEGVDKSKGYVAKYVTPESGISTSDIGYFNPFGRSDAEKLERKAEKIRNAPIPFAIKFNFLCRSQDRNIIYCIIEKRENLEQAVENIQLLTQCQDVIYCKEGQQGEGLDRRSASEPPGFSPSSASVKPVDKSVSQGSGGCCSVL